MKLSGIPLRLNPEHSLPKTQLILLCFMRSINFLKTLGSGAFGTVYLAELNSGHNFRRNIAIKILKTTDGNNHQFVSRVRDEARLLGLLQDDEILQVMGLEKIQGKDAILMEYVEGVDISRVIKQQTHLPHKTLASIGAICSGVLHRAHTATDPRTQKPLNVIHRDIKPANIMITKNGSIKICDFGVARARFEGQESITLDPDTLFGTLNYMAPEYIRTGTISPSADIYALGLSILEIATQRKLGKPKLRRREHEEYIQKTLRISKLPPPILNILNKMLLWNHADRPTGKECQYLFYAAADQVSGVDLRRWAEQTIPPLLHAQKEIEDTIGLLGQTISLAAPYSASASSEKVEVTAELPLIEPDQTETVPSFLSHFPFRPTQGIFAGLLVGLLLYALTLFLHFLPPLS